MGLDKLSSSARRYLNRFKRDEQGVTAIEFALVLPPFLMLTLGTLEVAFMQITNSNIAHSIHEISRPIYTGNASCDFDAEDFRAMVCQDMSLVSEADCMGNTKIVIEQIADFTAQRNQDLSSVTESADTGAGGDTMMVQVYHSWETMFPYSEKWLGGKEGAVTLVQSTAFRNEPYGSNTSCEMTSPLDA